MTKYIYLKIYNFTFYEIILTNNRTNNVNDWQFAFNIVAYDLKKNTSTTLKQITISKMILRFNCLGMHNKGFFLPFYLTTNRTSEVINYDIIVRIK